MKSLMTIALIVAILLPMLLAAAFLLGRHLPRRRDLLGQFSPRRGNISR